MLFTLLAATGLRVGEAFALRSTDVRPDCRVLGATITVRQQATRGGLTNRLKTKNAYRIIDVHSSVAAELAAFIDKRTTGLVFATSKGTAYNPSNLRNRLLYPILEEAGLDRAGFHAFRRYRVTWLRKNRVQEDLMQCWTGHGDKTVTDGYSQLENDTQYRKMVTEQVGIGFEIPPVVQNVQKSEKEGVTKLLVAKGLVGASGFEPLFMRFLTIWSLFRFRGGGLPTVSGTPKLTRRMGTKKNLGR